MKVLAASSECSPLARTGGLGEVVAGLAGALTELEIEVTVAIPRYRHLARLGSRQAGAGPAEAVYHHLEGDLSILLIDDPIAFDREGIYGPSPGDAYPDEWWRWGRFSLAVSELAQDFDLLHLHDGHAGPAALLSSVPTVSTIHNASYSVQGPLADVVQLLGVDPALGYAGGPLEWYGSAHYLKAALVGAARTTTVSPSFARQLTEDHDVAGGLDGVIRALPHPITGIVNGIDASGWDPRNDAALPLPFSPGRLSGRRMARAELLTAAGLDDGFVVGNVGRMSEQKGLQLLAETVDQLAGEGMRLVLVGSGELDPLVDGWVTRLPGAVSHLPYEEELARLLFAGADAYLMPSRFEPCGLGQIYAMRYGCPPMARLTGGLADTVVDLDEQPGRATGFGFRPFLADELAKTVRRAMRVYSRSRGEWRALQRRGMQHDWSWTAAAAAYLDVYESALR